MPSLKDLKVRIKSVKSTQKITKAMKMVAAAKLRRAREAAENAAPYALAMENMVARLAAGVEDKSTAPLLLTGTGRDRTELLVVMTADRGLCGAFNSGVVRAARKHIRAQQAEGKTVKLYTIGRKATDWLGTEFKALHVGSLPEVTKSTSYALAESVVSEWQENIDAGHIDRVTLLYNRFRSVISQIPTFQTLMPLLDVASPAVDASEVGAGASYEYEPSEAEILADILPRNLAMQLFKAMLDNNAGFYGAQMNAMENATKNAGEMIKKLTLKYNRTRQANITKELIEIISGAEAI